MRPELERLRYIEHHLLGNPRPDEAQNWALQQLLDAELETDAEAQQLAYQALVAAGRHQLRQELQLIHAQLYGPHVGRQPLSGARRRALRTSWNWLRRKF